MKLGLDGFADNLRQQIDFFSSRGVAVYGELLGTVLTLLERGELSSVGEAWQARSFAGPWERPLLLCASLRRDALADSAHPLAPFIGDGGRSRESAPAGAIVEALRAGAPALRSLRERFVQTNEVSRSFGWRLALSRYAESPKVALFDLGCSAALNLVADRVSCLGWSDGSGRPVTLPSTTNVAIRRGIDRAPVDVCDPDARLWLQACIWPGQTERERRLREALDAAVAALGSGELGIEVAGAESMPDVLGRFSRAHPDVPVVAFQSSVLTYLSPEVFTAYVSGMRGWLTAHPGRATWVEFEDARDAARGPAETRVSWAEAGAVESRVIAWSEYHPMLINLDETALKRMRSPRETR